MKAFTRIFYLLIVSIVLASCTPQALNDNDTNSVENTQASGDDEAEVTENGDKD
jgi:hypothetical protein